MKSDVLFLFGDHRKLKRMSWEFVQKPLVWNSGGKEVEANYDGSRSRCSTNGAFIHGCFGTKLWTSCRRPLEAIWEWTYMGGFMKCKIWNRWSSWHFITIWWWHKKSKYREAWNGPCLKLISYHAWSCLQWAWRLREGWQRPDWHTVNNNDARWVVTWRVIPATLLQDVIGGVETKDSKRILMLLNGHMTQTASYS